MKTRDELIKQVVELDQSNQAYAAREKVQRQEFAKAFGWFKKRIQYDYGESEPSSPSWEQIFVELGRILAARDFRDVEGNISEIDMRLNEIERVAREKKENE